MANKYRMLLALADGTGSGIALAAEVGEALARRIAVWRAIGVDRAVLGPADKDVAKKYRGDAGAATQLAKMVRGGCFGA